MQSGCSVRRGHRCVMFKAILTDKLQQVLQFANLYHRATAEGVERVVHKITVSHVRSDAAGAVISRDPGISKGACRRSSGYGAIGIFGSQGCGEDLCVCHFHISKKTLSPVATMKQHTFVRLTSVVVIPIHQGAWSTGS